VINTVGVVGLGHMGHAFATNLVEDGYQVLIHDRNPKRVAELLPTGAHGAAQLRDLAQCDMVLTSLPDDDALAAVALAPDGLASVLAVNAVHISMSTVSPALSGRLAQAHADRGQDYVAAPVLGNPDFAKARKLFVLAAGRPVRSKR
jgi:3-hydroxyisobutyrate dehydrogenase-like beta-hydroxyacid dehydrogenase